MSLFLANHALDLPASADATQRSAILGARTATPVCGDHLDAVGRHQGVVEAIAVAAVADQSRREVSEESGVEGRGDEVWLIR
jgi:hypothetical protein